MAMMVTSSAMAGASISAHAQVGSGTWYGLQNKRVCLKCMLVWPSQVLITLVFVW
jgi:hypothetical protein